MVNFDTLAEIKNLIEKIKIVNNIQSSISQDTVVDLLANFSSLERALREHIQLITQKQITSIIDKLKTKKPLAREDLSCIELWIVGDAQYYTKLKINYSDWMRELNKVLEDIKTLSQYDFDLDSCNTLRAVIKDGIRNLSDIDYFIREQQRVEQFQKSIQQLDDEGRDMLISILENKLESENF